jgi:hypothetical protein
MSWCFLVFELLFVGGIYVRAAPVMVIWCCCPAAWELLLAFSWFPCCPHAAQHRKKGSHVLPSTKTCTTSCFQQNPAPPHAEFPTKHNAMMTSISNVQHII